MNWLKNWVLRTFFSNVNDPQMWRKMLDLLVGPRVASLILSVVQAVEAGKIPVVMAGARTRAAPPIPTGAEKQAAAQSEILKQLEALGIQLGTVLLRLAIEVAVAYLRSQTGGL